MEPPLGRLLQKTRETQSFPDDIAIRYGGPDAAEEANFGRTKEFPKSENNFIQIAELVAYSVANIPKEMEQWSDLLVPEILDDAVGEQS